MMRRQRHLKAVQTLLALAAVLVVLNHSGGGTLSAPPLDDMSAWSEWLVAREPLEAAFALLRVVSIAAAWYSLVALLVGTALRWAGAFRLVRLTDRLTPAVLRRSLAGAATLTLSAAGPLGLTALADETVVMHRLPPASAQPAPAATPLTSPPTTAPTTGPTTTTPPTQSAAPTVAAEWTVMPGQCFWTIADTVLTRSWGRPATDAEIVPYWSRLIEANRARLSDPADPDLVHPGQVFSVPPVS